MNSTASSLMTSPLQDQFGDMGGWPVAAIQRVGPGESCGIEQPATVCPTCGGVRQDLGGFVVCSFHGVSIDPTTPDVTRTNTGGVR